MLCCRNDVLSFSERKDNMKLDRFVCESCGGNSFRLKQGFYECEYCGSKYFVDQNDTVVKKTLTDAKVLACYMEAEKHAQKGIYSEELIALSKALDMDPNNAGTLIKLGRCYRHIGLQEKALEAYRKAIEIDPQEGTAYTNTGAIYLLNENYAEADRYYKKGLPYIPDTEADYWQAYANHAIVVAKLGDRSKAKAMIKEAERHGYKNGDGCRKMAGIKKFLFF